MIAQFIRETALVLAPRGVRVNAVHPTNCNTDLLPQRAHVLVVQTGSRETDAGGRDDGFPSMQAIPIPYIEPSDVSNAVLFLASDESRYVTGLQLRVDGGGVIKSVPGAL